MATVARQWSTAGRQQRREKRCRDEDDDADAASIAQEISHLLETRRRLVQRVMQSRLRASSLAQHPGSSMPVHSPASPPPLPMSGTPAVAELPSLQSLPNHLPSQPTPGGDALSATPQETASLPVINLMPAATPPAPARQPAPLGCGGAEGVGAAAAALLLGGSQPCTGESVPSQTPEGCAEGSLGAAGAAPPQGGGLPQVPVAPRFIYAAPPAEAQQQRQQQQQPSGTEPSASVPVPCGDDAQQPRDDTPASQCSDSTPRQGVAVAASASASVPIQAASSAISSSAAQQQEWCAAGTPEAGTPCPSAEQQQQQQRPALLTPSQATGGVLPHPEAAAAASAAAAAATQQHTWQINDEHRIHCVGWTGSIFAAPEEAEASAVSVSLGGAYPRCVAAVWGPRQASVLQFDMALPEPTASGGRYDLFDLSTISPQQHAARYTACSVAPSGVVVTGLSTGEVSAHDPRTGDVLWSVPPDAASDGVRALRFGPLSTAAGCATEGDPAVAQLLLLEWDLGTSLCLVVTRGGSVSKLVLGGGAARLVSTHPGFFGPPAGVASIAATGLRRPTIAGVVRGSSTVALWDLCTGAPVLQAPSPVAEPRRAVAVPGVGGVRLLFEGGSGVACFDLAASAAVGDSAPTGAPPPVAWREAHPPCGFGGSGGAQVGPWAPTPDARYVVAGVGGSLVVYHRSTGATTAAIPLGAEQTGGGSGPSKAAGEGEGAEPPFAVSSVAVHDSAPLIVCTDSTNNVCFFVAHDHHTRQG